MRPALTHGVFFLGAAVLAGVFFLAAMTPHEKTLPGVWERQAADRETGVGERSEALYRLGMHRERFGDYDGAMEAYHQLLTDVPYVPVETAAIAWGFRHDEARLRYREILARQGRGEITLKGSWPPH